MARSIPDRLASPTNPNQEHLSGRPPADIVDGLKADRQTIELSSAQRRNLGLVYRLILGWRQVHPQTRELGPTESEA